MSDMGTVVLVTGATDGIGKETAIELARRGARVLVHGRNGDRAKETVAAIEAVRPGAALEPLILDLARLAEVRAAGDELDRRGVAVTVLINNAGVYMRERVVSADGFELSFAVNHLAPFALTHALLRARRGAELSRIVNVSSIAHARGRIDFEDGPWGRRRFDGYTAYAASKLANVLFTVELARRFGEGGPRVNALHPGVVSTKLLVDGMGARGNDSAAEGADTSVRLALDADLANATGQYWSAGRPASMNPLARDAALAARFYEWSAELAGVAPLPADAHAGSSG
jgi:NAD(P)-dependent dehydrogenase (short-subunit alcohol dehydrogenase family)